MLLWKLIWSLTQGLVPEVCGSALKTTVNESVVEYCDIKDVQVTYVSMLILTWIWSVSMMTKDPVTESKL
jgi:hypothetical protein